MLSTNARTLSPPKHRLPQSGGPEALSLHALALAGASLASPTERVPPRGFFGPVTGIVDRGAVSHQNENLNSPSP